MIDYHKLQDYLADLCDSKHPQGLRIAGFLYLNPKKHKLQILAANRKKAIYYLKQAALLGDQIAILFFLKQQKKTDQTVFYQKLWHHCLTFRWPETHLLWLNLPKEYRDHISLSFRKTQQKCPKIQKRLPPPLGRKTKPTPSYKKIAPTDLWRHVTTPGQKHPNHYPIGLDKSRPDIMLFYVEISSK